MAYLRASHVGSTMGGDRDRQRNSGSPDRLLRVKALDVYLELRPGRLGDP